MRRRAIEIASPVILVAAFAVVALAAADRQQLGGSVSDLKFEVASIKPIKQVGDAPPVPAGAPQPRNRFNFYGPAAQLLQRAYGVRRVQLIDAPDWVSSAADNYQIVATFPDGVEGTPENVSAMIRSLLADRFKAVLREETREMPLYELVHARADKALGPNIKPVAPECLVPGSKCETRLGTGPGGPDLPPGTRVIRGRNQSIEMLATAWFGIEPRVGRTVIDRTGLTGRYDFDLSFADPRVSLTPTDAPSLFDALEEQLGLKLVPSRGPVRVLVVVSIDRPTPD